jgi:hypothetical protein
MARPQLHSGARGKLVINGKPLAFITDVSVSEVVNLAAPHTFGALNARSVEPLSTDCNVSIGRVIPVSNPNGEAFDSSTIASGIQSLISLMLTADDIEVQLLDNVTDATIAAVKNCRYGGRQFSVAAQGLASERISLQGIYDGAGGNTPDKLGY